MGEKGVTLEEGEGEDAESDEDEDENLFKGDDGEVSDSDDDLEDTVDPKQRKQQDNL